MAVQLRLRALCLLGAKKEEHTHCHGAQTSRPPGPTAQGGRGLRPTLLTGDTGPQAQEPTQVSEWCELCSSCVSENYVKNNSLHHIM